MKTNNSQGNLSSTAKSGLDEVNLGQLKAEHQMSQRADGEDEIEYQLSADDHGAVGFEDNEFAYADAGADITFSEDDPGLPGTSGSVLDDGNKGKISF